MGSFSRAKAEAAISDLNLETSNRALAEYWLSLWPGDALPPREAFSPSKLKSYLSNLLVFNVVPDRSVTVRLAGTGFRHILGMELTGGDWIALAPENHRSTRLVIFSRIARGSICVAHRRIAMTVGEDYISEEILLPFAADASGAHQVLCYVNWKPHQFLKIKSVKQVTGDPLDVRFVSLTETTPATVTAEAAA